MLTCSIKWFTGRVHSWYDKEACREQEKQKVMENAGGKENGSSKYREYTRKRVSGTLISNRLLCYVFFSQFIDILNIE